MIDQDLSATSTEQNINRLNKNPLARLRTRMKENQARNKGWFMRMNYSIFGERAPRMSESASAKITIYLPWMFLLSGIFGLVMTLQYCISAFTELDHFLGLLGIDSIGSAMSSNSRLFPVRNITILALFSIVIMGIYFTICSIFAILAFPGLAARQKQGWTYAYRAVAMIAGLAYASIISWVTTALLSQIFDHDRTSEILILPVLIGATGLYILFQTRSRYKES